MENEKKSYQTPEFTVIVTDKRDMLTTSSGSDALDNWSDDVFN